MVRSRNVLPMHKKTAIQKGYGNNLLSQHKRRRHRRRRKRVSNNDASWVPILLFCLFLCYLLLRISSLARRYVSRYKSRGHAVRKPLNPIYVENEEEIIDILTSVIDSKTTWPVSVRNEEDSFEIITHPADEEIVLSVPKFFIDMPIGDGNLMTKRITSKIGSHSKEEGRLNDSPNSRTIFVMVASYRDWQCRFTVESVFERATFPDRIRVAVVDQIEADLDPSCDVPIYDCAVDPEQALCKYRDKIDVYEMEANLAVGPIFARHIGNRMYRGEYYALQVDAHVTFVTGWDVSLIEQHIATNNEMAVLTTYLTDVEGSIDPDTGNSLRTTRPIMCNTNYEGDGHQRRLRHFSQPETQPFITGSPQLEPFWAAGFSFSRGHFIINVPYDQHLPMVFQGEEISIGLRAFTFGYDFYAPEHSVCFHAYIKNENDGIVAVFTEHANLYEGVEMNSMARLLGIIEMDPDIVSLSWKQDELDKYGIGQVRELSKFFTTYGIHVQAKRSERLLCNFVAPGKMHNMFTQYLRDDGMGINYDQIKYRYHELATIHE